MLLVQKLALLSSAIGLLLSVKLHLRHGRTDGRTVRPSARPSVRVLDGGWHLLVKLISAYNNRLKQHSMHADATPQWSMIDGISSSQSFAKNGANHFSEVQKQGAGRESGRRRPQKLKQNVKLTSKL